MSDSVKPIPDGYHAITPYLITQNATEAIEFYKTVFGATQVELLPRPDGGVAHAELRIGDSIIMLADEMPEMGYLGPRSIGGSPVHLMIYTEDCDAMFARAVEAGATVKRDLQDQFYGDRAGSLTDPFGHDWTIATHVEDVDPEELQKRFQEMMQE